MKFKVGDKVRVREDLIENELSGNYIVIKEMLEMKGKVATIEQVNDRNYFLVEDNHMLHWTDDFLEEIDPNEEIKKAIQYLWDKNMLTCDEKETLTKRLKEKEEK